MAELIGYKKMEGNSKKTGRPYSGYIFYCTDQQYNDPQCQGKIAFEKFVSSDIIGGVPYVGAQVNFVFDFRGYLTAVTVE